MLIVSLDRYRCLLQARLASVEANDDVRTPIAVMQLHLDHGTSERTYWHLGYRTALRDLLCAIDPTSADMPQQPETPLRHKLGSPVACEQ